jgi:subtilisin family serine protease
LTFPGSDRAYPLPYTPSTPQPTQAPVRSPTASPTQYPVFTTPAPTTPATPPPTSPTAAPFADPKMAAPYLYGPPIVPKQPLLGSMPTDTFISKQHGVLQMKLDKAWEFLGLQSKSKRKDQAVAEIFANATAKSRVRYPVAVDDATPERSTEGRVTIVAVIDDGVDYEHPDLASNIWVNEGEIPNNGIDDDGNGFVDDYYGWNFIKDSPDSRSDGADEGHGTHCAGVIGAVADNKQGVAGVNWRGQVGYPDRVGGRFIMPLKIFESDLSTASATIRALNYAIRMGAKVSSNSYGGPSPSKVMERAICNSAKWGHVFIAAAGNENINNDRQPSYPCNYKCPNVLSVAALDQKGKYAYFSNTGSKTVHVAAPGVDIHSTYQRNGYTDMSGTSMATPHVSGLAALIYDRYPDMSAADVRATIIHNADNAPSDLLKGRKTVKGMVNAYKSLTNPIYTSA